MAESLTFSLLKAERRDVLPYVLAAGIAFISIVLFIRSRNPLSSVPGPFWAKWSNLWLVYHCRKGHIHRKMIEVHKKYGTLVRVGPNEVSTADIESLKTIYGAGNDFRKSDWYSVWQGSRKWDLFSERNEDIHRSQRRLVSHIYSLSSMKKLEPYVDNAITFFLTKLSTMEGQRIDVNKWVRLFAYDVIGEVTFSKRFGFIDEGKDDGAFTMIDNILYCANWVGHIPWFYWINVWLSPVIGNRLAVMQRQGKLLNLAANEIKERKQRGTDHHDMLEQLFDVQREKPDKLDDISVTSMAASNIFAGSDSTSVSISAFLYHVLRNPDCKRKLIEEVDAKAEAENVSRGAVFDLDVINNMPYLQACMYEALRCHPAVGVSLGRVVPPVGMKIGGQYIPGGSGISANAWVIHLDKEVFGEDADKFRPERWMEDPNRVSNMSTNLGPYSTLQ
ncbi:cytochrome P450 family protein [Truncatella angustata]|uniref:Cytochrome P450 family protein n=1 Tax=Truncatella angustata TaxID=152316 RepID=A0A9P9A1Z7_9PEZI|nr:cytochrome P450 family protein [Truncatella angustata]KAH6658877.1 cytochrome P450 family protein [Truncatella angustata]